MYIRCTMNKQDKELQETLELIKELGITIFDACGELTEAVTKLNPQSFKKMPFHSRSRKHLKEFAQQCKKDGYSVRQIAKMMGYKSPHSVQQLLKEKK